MQYRKVERVVRSFANHRRLRILELLMKDPDMTLDTIAERIGAQYFNVSDHVRRLTMAGLVAKRNHGPVIHHSLTGLGRSILGFCKKLK